MKMRRFQLAIMALALFALVMTGCEKEGKKPAPEAQSTEQETPPEEQEPPKEKTFSVGEVSFMMKLIPAGTATLGSDDQTNNPDHEVKLSDYRIGATQVTQELYEAVMEINPSAFKDSPANGEEQGKRPVEKVSWYDAVAFCNELTKKITEFGESEYVYYSDEAMENAYTKDDAVAQKTPYANWTKKGFRLPTEAEWEWAAKGGSAENKHSGAKDDSELADYAWYSDNSGNKTHEVGKRTAMAMACMI